MIDKLRGGLHTTVVGSFPYTVDKNLMKNQDWSTVQDIRETSLKALGLQIEAGIEFPSDGQFFDMMEMYLTPLKMTGFLRENRTFGDGPAPDKHPSTELAKELEKKARTDGALGLRVPITGPFTLAYRVKREGESLAETGDLEGVRLLAKAVTSYCKGFEKTLKGSILSVDEPVLPFVIQTFPEDFIKETLKDVFKVINNNYSCMHICGAVKSIKNLALSLDVDILDHEFQGTDNSRLYSKEELEANNKLLSFGLVNTNPKQVFPKSGNYHVETASELKETLNAASKVYGLKNLLISPDCGFGGWKYVKRPEDGMWKIIQYKLSRMVQARNDFLNINS
jgi:methionine synthase II (cobalamin-independent)